MKPSAKLQLAAAVTSNDRNVKYTKNIAVYDAREIVQTTIFFLKLPDLGICILRSQINSFKVSRQNNSDDVKKFLCQDVGRYTMFFLQR